MKTSLLYILFEAIAKGGPHLFLIIIASTVSNTLYNGLLLLVSAEGLIALTYFSNYAEAIYALKERFETNRVINTVLNLNLVSVSALVILVYLFREALYGYYDYLNIYTFYCILGIAFFNITFRFIVLNFQLEEEHNFALKLKFMPFMLSFILSICGFYLFEEDQIFGFFLGKLIGFVLFFIFYARKLKFKLFIIEFEIFKAYANRIKNLVIVYLTGWLSGYGYLNIVKQNVSAAALSEMGYVLNIFTLFLLVSNGINQVYTPKLKKEYQISLNNAVALAKKFHLIYIVLIALSLLGYYTFNNFITISYIDKYVPYIGWSCAIFAISTFHYISSPFYYIVDKYKRYMNINLISNIIGASIMFILIVVFQSTEIKMIYISFIFTKCTLPYIDLIINKKRIFST